RKSKCVSASLKRAQAVPSVGCPWTSPSAPPSDLPPALPPFVPSAPSLPAHPPPLSWTCRPPRKGERSCPSHPVAPLLIPPS
ncbi:hypothetical protein AVEN_28080-1, partial [Araneus ventricosus]